MTDRDGTNYKLQATNYKLRCQHNNPLIAITNKTLPLPAKFPPTADSIKYLAFPCGIQQVTGMDANAGGVGLEREVIREDGLPHEPHGKSDERKQTYKSFKYGLPANLNFNFPLARKPPSNSSSNPKQRTTRTPATIAS